MSSLETEFVERAPRSVLKTLVAIGALATALLAIGAATKAWVILPYRMEQQEAAIKALDAVDAATARELREQRDLLLDIRGDVRAMKERRTP